MKKIFALFLAAMMLLSLASCGDDGKVTINVYNWGEYISDGEDGTLDVIREFEQETGIKVNYTTYATNEEMYAKIKNGAGDYDVIIPSDYMISRMIEEDMLEKLDLENIKNYDLIMDDYKTCSYDPTGEYSIPYTWGVVGIIYNKEKVTKPVDSWDILWDEDYKGKILMFNNSRDAFAIALKRLGYSMNTTDLAQIKEAADLLTAQKSVRQSLVMDEIFDLIGSGESWIAPYYAGDALTIMSENENIGFAIPKEGTNRFVDAMCIPKGSKHKTEAEMFIDFMCRTDIVIANSEVTCYSVPQKEAYEQLDDEVKNNEYAYPSKEVLENTEEFIHLPKDVNAYIQNLWIGVQVD